MTGLTAKEFKARNGRLSIIDEGKKRAAGLNAWSLYLSAAALSQSSNLELAGQALWYMQDTVELLPRRLEKMK